MNQGSAKRRHSEDDSQNWVKTEKKKPRNNELSIFSKGTMRISQIRVPIVLLEDHSATAKKNSSRSRGYKDFEKEKHLKLVTSNIRINRARIFDWLLDVCRAFELRW